MRIYKAEVYMAIILSDILDEEVKDEWTDDEVLAWLEGHAHLVEGFDSPNAILLLQVAHVQQMLLELYDHAWPEPPIGEIYIKMDI